MKIAIISDTHDNLPNLKTFLKYIQENPVEAILHCGDVCSEETLTHLCQEFNGPIYLSLGNCDDRRDIANIVDDPPENLKIFPALGKAQLGGLKLAFLHFPEEAKDAANQQIYDFVFHGHTHQPWLEKIGNCHLANPGNIAGLYFNPSFAILDCKTKKLELKLLNHL